MFIGIFFCLILLIILFLIKAAKEYQYIWLTSILCFLFILSTFTIVANYYILYRYNKLIIYEKYHGITDNWMSELYKERKDFDIKNWLFTGIIIKLEENK